MTISAKLAATLLLGVLVTWPAGAAEVLYARSNGALRAHHQPGRYSALNVLDGNPATCWCTAGSGKGAELEVVFSETVHINRLEIATGNQKSAATFSAFTRVKALQLYTGDMTQVIDLTDTRGRQTVEFPVSIDTRRVVFRLQAGHRGKSQRHACISDVIFFEDRRALNGKKLTRYIRRSRRHLAFLDTWVSGPEEARNRELVFGVQGRFWFWYVPHDPMREPVELNGPWRLKGGTPQIRINEKWLPLRVKHDDAGRVIRLKVESNELLPANMPGVYSRRRQVYTW